MIANIPHTNNAARLFRWKSVDGIAVLGLFVVSWLTRLAYLFVFRPPFDGVYWNLSSRLIDNSGPGNISVITDFEPLYPIVLAALRLLVGDDTLRVQIGQAAMASAGAVYLYLLGLTLTGRKQIAVIAAVLYALHPLLIRQAAAASDLALVTVLVLGFSFHFVNAAHGSHLATAGIALGLAALTRTMTLPLAILAAAVLISQRRQRAALVLTTTVVIFVLPLVARNWRTNGSLMPTRSGLALYVGNSPFSSAVLPDYDVDILEEYAERDIQAHLSHVTDTSPEYSRAANEFLTKWAIDHMRERPFATVRQKVLNIGYFFSPRLVPLYVAGPDTRAIRRDGHVVIERPYERRAIEWISYSLFYTPVVTAAIWGVFLSKQFLRRAAILWCVVITFVAIHALYFPATRYRAPMEFALLLYASVAIDHVARRIQPYCRDTSAT